MQAAGTSNSNATPAAPHPVVAARVLIHLLIAVAASVLCTAGATAAFIGALHRPGLWPAWAAALVVSLVAAIMALGPVIPGLYAGARYTAYGYLAGSGLRMLAALAGGLICVIVVHTPAAPTLLLTIPLYVAQLAAEAIVLGRAFWPRH